MIKKYLEFIRESIKEDMDEGKFWKIDEDDIRQFLIDLEDENYNIIVTFGFVENQEHFNYSSGKTTNKEVFTEKLLPGEKVTPAYWVQIESNSNTTSTDVTDSLIFANDIIKEKVDGNISVHDKDGKLDISNVQLKGGLWIGTDESEQLKAEEYIALFIKQNNSVEFTDKQVCEYYGLEYDAESKSGGVYIHVDLEDLADILLDRNSDYKKTLIGGTEEMWDNYESHYYIPDIPTFFQYTLDKENEILMVKSIIKEMGGLEETINHIGDECSDEAYESVKGKSEDEVIDYLLKERFYDTLKQLCNNSDITDEIKQTVADWEMSAHVDDNYKSILSEFDDIADKEFKYQKIEKDNWVKSEGYSNGGYTQSITYYEVEFDSRWMDDFDSDSLFRESSIRNIFDEWCGQQWFTYNLNPRIDDYGNVDSKKLNEDIKHYLLDHLNH